MTNCRPALVLVATFAFSIVPFAGAQSPPIETAPAVPASAPQMTPVDYSFDLNHLVDAGAGARTVYSLRATEPPDSKLTGQKIRLAITTTTPQGTFTRLLNLNTGKHKTVAQLCASLRDIFRKDQTLGANASGQDLGKVGDIKFGGEVRFVAESPEQLRCDIQTRGTETHSISFTASEVADLVALLAPPVQN